MSLQVSCCHWAAELLRSSVASFFKKKKKKKSVSRSICFILSEMLMFFKLQRCHTARKCLPWSTPLDNCPFMPGWGLHTEGCEIGLCFDSTSIYGVGLFSESHFLVFSFNYNKNNIIKLLGDSCISSQARLNLNYCFPHNCRETKTEIIYFINSFSLKFLWMHLMQLVYIQKTRVTIVWWLSLPW